VTPARWEFVVIALVAFRLWKLIADDRILERPREWVLDRIDVRRGSTYWSDFIVCPWCAGFWVSGLTLAAYLSTLGSWPDDLEGAVVAVGVWFALSAVVGILGELLYAERKATGE